MSGEVKLPTARCQSEAHCEHLCTLSDQYFHVHEAERFRALVAEPKCKCQFCGRVAKSSENLCFSAEL